MTPGPQTGGQRQDGYRENGEGEGILPGQKSKPAGDGANDDGTNWTYSDSIRLHPGGHADKERQRIDCQCKQCPADGTEPAILRRIPMMMIIVMAPVTDFSRVTPPPPPRRSAQYSRGGKVTRVEFADSEDSLRWNFRCAI